MASLPKTIRSQQAHFVTQNVRPLGGEPHQIAPAMNGLAATVHNDPDESNQARLIRFAGYHAARQEP